MFRHLLDATYLYATAPAPTWRWSPAILLSAAAYSAIGGALAMWLARRRPGKQGLPAWGWIGSAGWVAAGLLTLLRPMLWGLASARVWAVSAAAYGTIVVAIGTAQSVPAPVATWARRHRSLAWGGLATLHGLGLIAWLRYDGPTLPWALGVIALAADGLLDRWRGRGSSTGLLVGVPLALTYTSLLLRWLVGDLIGVDVAPYQAFAGADLISPWFCASTMGWVGSGGTLLLALRRASRDQGQFRRWAGVAALVAGLVIAGAVAGRHMAAGATASDPYCYLQMAADLAEQGTVFHPFPLAAVAREAGVPVWPVAHVGYHVPDARNMATTVWPIGWPLLLAPVYWALGEGAALWAAMLCLMATALLTAWLCRRVLRDSPWGGWLAAGLAGMLVVTSQEAVLRSLVPMADGAAALVSVAMIACLVRARETRAIAWSLAAGAFFAAAYWVRHPLLFLGLGALPAYGVGRAEERIAWKGLLAFAAAALTVALPDLIYHTVAFGAPWVTESPEWFLLGPAHVLPNLWAMAVEGYAQRGEFGYLWPLTLWGLTAGWRQRRMDRGTWLVLAWSLAGAAGFQLAYQALRWRDLVSLFPWFAIWTALGTVELLRWLPEGRWRAAGVALILTLTLSRGAWLMALPSQDTVPVFGHVTRGQREEFRRLGEHLPADAVVATGLGSGAVARYTGRQTMRPASWTETEFAAMLDRVAVSGHSIWLLDDGEEVADLLTRIPEGWRIVTEDSYALPTFGWGGDPLGHAARLWRLTPHDAREPAEP